MGMGKDGAVTRAARTGPQVFVALALVAFNLRTPLTSIPTVVPDIQAALGLGEVAIGTLTSLPILCMGALAFVVPGIAAWFGPSRVVWLATGLLVLAMGMRAAGTVPGVLPTSAVLAGIGIALAGGLVPGIVREQLPTRIGLVTGLWTAAMLGGAALAAALTVPLAGWLGSWELALACWSVPALLAWLAWTVVERPHRPSAHVRTRSAIRDLPWRSPVGWALTVFLAMNSIVFYSSVAWLAPSFEAQGLSQADSGYLFGVYSAVAIVSGLAFPPLLQHTRWPRAMLVGVLVVAAASLLGIAVAPTAATIVWVVGFGLANGAWFTMGLALVVMVSSDGAEAARLTAMAYTVMYLVAAVGPVACGALIELTGSWTLLFALLALCSLVPLAVIGRLHPRASQHASA